MPLGPGKYDALVTWVREQTKAEGVIVIVVQGENGDGFSCQATPSVTQRLPGMLEHMAKEIRASFKKREL
jgi:hypothetical protein